MKILKKLSLLLALVCLLVSSGCGGKSPKVLPFVQVYNTCPESTDQAYPKLIEDEYLCSPKNTLILADIVQRLQEDRDSWKREALCYRAQTK